MRVIDVNGAELSSYDLSAGYLIEDRIFITHYPAIDAIPEQFHYEVVKEYPNGGKDLIKVIDSPAVQSVAAYDEYEDVLRYIEFPSGILDKKYEDYEARISELEAALELLLSGVTE